MARRPGFTLIELLVVVTIIVVLLALLTPALDKAVYQAELTQCAARIKGVCIAATVYAADNKRRYPKRLTVTPGYKSLAITGANMDDRPTVRPYMPINKLLMDPLVKSVDLDGSLAGTVVYCSYSLWFDWEYHAALGGPGMHKLGDRFTWDNDKYSLLACDTDEAVGYASHPDRDGRMVNLTAQDGADPAGSRPEGIMLPNDTRWTFSRWVGSGGGPQDMNYGYADGSVRRVNDIRVGDQRMAYIPVSTGGLNAFTWGLYVPTE